MSAKLDVVASVRWYVDKICSDPSMTGMKVLLLDSVTSRIMAMVYSQTQVLEKEVYLIETLDSLNKKAHINMPHLKAAVFIQPTESNLTALLTEIREPKFSEYHIFFSNIVPPDVLLRLARADEHEIIKQVNTNLSERRDTSSSHHI
jgi:vacuolar protein sorting-associated protein 45